MDDILKKIDARQSQMKKDQVFLKQQEEQLQIQKQLQVQQAKEKAEMDAYKERVKRHLRK